MASASPPKPWERGGATTTVPSAAPLPPSTAATAASSPAAPTAGPVVSSSAPPQVPTRPSNLVANTATTGAAATNSAYSPYNRTGYSPYNAMNSYGTYGGYGGAYGSPYSRMGGMYGTMGGMYGGFGGYGAGPIDPNDPGSLMRGMESSTAATFQMIESIVGAVGGFAQMLESTFMATHSSFFAMVSVAEQFHNLRQTLGSVLGIFTLIRYIKIAIAKLTGRPIPATAKGLDSKGFADFLSPKPKPSRKPLFFFIAAIVGLPYLMTKLIKTLAAAEQKRAAMMNPGGVPQPMVDPSQLEFARAKWDYKPEGNGQGVDLEVAKGDLVAILGKTGEGDQQWWRCRARDGRVGYLPGGWLEVITRKPKAVGAIQGAEAKEDLNSNVSTVGAFSVEEFKKTV